MPVHNVRRGYSNTIIFWLIGGYYNTSCRKTIQNMSCEEIEKWIDSNVQMLHDIKAGRVGGALCSWLGHEPHSYTSLLNC